jgi:hypothetical protein
MRCGIDNLSTLLLKYGMQCSEENAHTDLVGKTREHLEELSIDGKVILTGKRVLYSFKNQQMHTCK